MSNLFSMGVLAFVCSALFSTIALALPIYPASGVYHYTSSANPCAVELTYLKNNDTLRVKIVDSYSSGSAECTYAGLSQVYIRQSDKLFTTETEATRIISEQKDIQYCKHHACNDPDNFGDVMRDSKTNDYIWQAGDELKSRGFCALGANDQISIYLVSTFSRNGSVINSKASRPDRMRLGGDFNSSAIPQSSSPATATKVPVQSHRGCKPGTSHWGGPFGWQGMICEGYDGTTIYY